MRATHNGLTVEVEVDDISENPREPIGTMVCWHRRYRLGDEHDFDTPRDFQESDMKRAYVVLPIYLYDHSMLALSTESFVGRAVHAEWDSGQVGYIYILPEKAKELTGYEPTEENRETVKCLLEEEIETYDNYLQGNVYAYTVTDENGDLIAGGNGYAADSMGEAVEEMKNCCYEYRLLFEKLQKQLCKQAIAN